MDINISDKQLKNLSAINVIIGKNGCGKSTILRELDGQRTGWTHVKYITPERGGKMAYAPNVENNMQVNVNWADQTRRQNHDETFREKSIAQLKQLETLVNRKAIKDVKSGSKIEKDFDEAIGLINSLLDNVKLVVTEKLIPEFRTKDGSAELKDESLSSGEKELISLASEVLHFVYMLDNAPQKPPKALLLLDEPDVHLHPDLQHRFIKLLAAVTRGKPLTILISTHSTAILSALSNEAPDSRVYFMKARESQLQFLPITKTLKDVVPIFGAHPLSNVFNEAPILLVEGEDDERIWQQAVRSSEGRLKFWPCQTTTVSKMNEYEDVVSSLVQAIYENAKAYSLRDRDNNPYEIDDKPFVIRCRLNCYAAENLILSDDVLISMGISWDGMKEKITAWLQDANNKHPKRAEMAEFAKTFDRRNHKIKDLEVLFLYLAAKSRPWEVLVGQAIAKLNSKSSSADGSLADFLGTKLVSALNLCA